MRNRRDIACRTRAIRRLRPSAVVGRHSARKRTCIPSTRRPYSTIASGARWHGRSQFRSTRWRWQTSCAPTHAHPKLHAKSALARSIGVLGNAPTRMRSVAAPGSRRAAGTCARVLPRFLAPFDGRGTPTSPRLTSARYLVITPAQAQGAWLTKKRIVTVLCRAGRRRCDNRHSSSRHSSARAGPYLARAECVNVDDLDVSTSEAFRQHSDTGASAAFTGGEEATGAWELHEIVDEPHRCADARGFEAFAACAGDRGVLGATPAHLHVRKQQVRGRGHHMGLRSDPANRSD